MLHLHGLHDQQSLTSFDAGSLLHRQRDNRAGHRSLDDARAACIGFGTGGDYLGAGQYPGAVGTGDDVLFVVRRPRIVDGLDQEVLCDSVADDAQMFPVAKDRNFVISRFWNVDIFVLRFGRQTCDYVTDNDVSTRRGAHNRDQPRVLPCPEANALRGRRTGTPAIRGQPR